MELPVPRNVDLDLASPEERAEVAEIHRLWTELDGLLAKLASDRPAGRQPHFESARLNIDRGVRWAVMGVVKELID